MSPHFRISELCEGHRPGHGQKRDGSCVTTKFVAGSMESLKLETEVGDMRLLCRPYLLSRLICGGRGFGVGCLNWCA
jgi:hypothetical protein